MTAYPRQLPILGRACANFCARKVPILGTAGITIYTRQVPLIGRSGVNFCARKVPILGTAGITVFFLRDVDFRPDLNFLYTPKRIAGVVLIFRFNHVYPPEEGSQFPLIHYWNKVEQIRVCTGRSAHFPIVISRYRAGGDQ